MITRLQVRNFKSLRDVDISLGSLNVLVGPNMSGKSNILDVLLFLNQVFFPQAGTQGVSYALAQRGGVNEVLWKGGDDKLITIVLECAEDADLTTGYKYSLELIAGAGDFTTVQKESLTLLRSGAESELLRPDQSSVQFMNADGKALGGIGQGGVSSMQHAFPSWDGYKFLQWAKLWRYYHLFPLAMKKPSPMALGQVLAINGENLSAWLMWLQTHSPEAFGRLNEVLRDLFPEVLQIKNIPTPDGNVHLSVDEKGLKRPTFVWQASDGFLALTALLSLIYVPPELSGTVFLVEEPENHLHPKLLETLVALLRQVRQEASQSRSPLAQILLTTQSPYLVDQFHLDEIVWVEKKKGETKAFRPSGKKHLRDLVKNKELGLGDLMYAGALGEEK
jgi:predicted ATPase